MPPIVPAVPATPAPMAVVTPPVAPPAAEPAEVEDWRAFVIEGDALMAQRHREEATEAYVEAFNLATDGRPVTAAEVAGLAKKVSQLQIMLGSNAEARQTLDRGRAALKRMTGPKDAVERQKLLEEIENSLRRLMRD